MCLGAISRCLKSLKTFGGNNNKCLQRSPFCFTGGRFERSEKRPEVKQNGLQRGVDRGAVAPLEYQGGLGGGTPPSEAGRPGPKGITPIVQYNHASLCYGSDARPALGRAKPITLMITNAVVRFEMLKHRSLKYIAMCIVPVLLVCDVLLVSFHHCCKIPELDYVAYEENVGRFYVTSRKRELVIR